MELRFGELPDDHVFLTRVRSLVDWSFKLIAWLLLCATLQVGAQATGNAYIWTLAILANILIYFFCQSALDWIWHLKRYKQRDERPKETKLLNKFFRWTRIIIASVLWFSLIAIQMKAVDEAIDALASFQTTKSSK
jgi:hypothetical protein